MDGRGINWDKENGVERDRRQFRLTKIHKNTEVDRLEIGADAGGYAKDRQI